MADFNVDTASAPAGAGQAVAPVQVQPVPEFNINSIIAQGANIFGEFVHNKNKADVEARQNVILSEYTQKENNIAQLAKQGKLSSSDALAASRMNFSQYAAANPGMYKDLAGMRSSLYAGGEIGGVEEKAKAIKAEQDRWDLVAEKYGLYADVYTSDTTKELNRKAAAAMQKSEVMWKQSTERNQEGRAAKAEARAEQSFDEKLYDRREKENAAAQFTQILVTSYDAFASDLQDINKAILSAKTPEEVTALNFKITQRFGDIERQARAIGGARNQDMVAGYIAPFRELKDTMVELSKPGADTKLLEERLKRIKLVAEISLREDPKVAQQIASSELIPNSPTMMLRAEKGVTAVMARNGSLPSDDPTYSADPVVGNAKVEDGVLGGLREGLQALQADKLVYGDKAKVTNECKNNINICLRQTEAIVNQGASPQALSKIAAFYASPEFGKAAESGILDNRALNGATTAFQVYNQAVVASVGEEMSKFAGEVKRGNAPTRISEAVDLSFNSGRVVFTPVAGVRHSAEGAKAMKKSEEAISHLVYIGAHLEGTRDYAKYWEKNRHNILPNLYYDIKEYPVGTVVKSKGKLLEYIGGPHKSERAWKEVKQDAATGN